MKGISAVVAVILLLLITISIAGFSFVFFTKQAEDTANQGEIVLENELESVSTEFLIDNIYENKVTVRNTGTDPISTSRLAFYLDNELVTGTPDSACQTSVATGKTCTVTLNQQLTAGEHEIKVAGGTASKRKTFTATTTATTSTSSTTSSSTTTTIQDYNFQITPLSAAVGYRQWVTVTSTDATQIDIYEGAQPGTLIKSCASSPCIYQAVRMDAGAHPVYVILNGAYGPITKDNSYQFTVNAADAVTYTKTPTFQNLNTNSPVVELSSSDNRITNVQLVIKQQASATYTLVSSCAFAQLPCRFFGNMNDSGTYDASIIIDGTLGTEKVDGTFSISYTYTSGGCILRDVSGVNDPVYTNPAVGAGYTLYRLPGISGLLNINNMCSAASGEIYQRMMTEYCRLNLANVNRRMAEYTNQNPGGGGCWSGGCGQYTCP